MKNIWILTEERPKVNVLLVILEKVASDQHILFQIKDSLKILPIIKDEKFTFVYKVTGISFKGFDSVYLKIVSGSSSFVDFLIFLQEKEPDQSSKPLYAIEETKTDDSESRNTGVYQRCSKFVYVEFYYPGIKKIMLYNLQIPQKKIPTPTNIFGMRMLLTIGVEVLGKVYDEKLIRPFNNLQELIELKRLMRQPPAGNTPIIITAYPDHIEVSGKLLNGGRLGHDPNIGALTIISLCIRKWEKALPIIITRHGVNQRMVGKANKFIQIAHRLNIHLHGLELPTPAAHDSYWHYDISKEKNATIFLHIALLTFTSAKIIYANHGGSEREYFQHNKLGLVAIKKYQDGKRAIYKAGDRSVIISIPDIIVFDPTLNQVICVEGKRYETRKEGISDLKNYTYIEKELIIPSHNPTSILRTVVIFGSKETAIQEKQISFLLNDQGKMVLGNNPPKIIAAVVARVLRNKDV